MARYNPPQVSGKYGAPMGRISCRTFTDRNGQEHLLAVTDNARPMTLKRVRMSADGCYDSGGAYWGNGAPLYYYEDATGSISGYVRAEFKSDATDKTTRGLAKNAVRAMFPNAKFFR